MRLVQLRKINPPSQIERVQYVMGTLLSIQMDSTDSECAHSWISIFFETLRTYESRWSVFVETSDLNQVARLAGKEPVSIHLSTYQLLKTALQLAHHTNGLFDPTIGPLINLWNRPTPPSPEQLHQTKKLINYTSLKLINNTQAYLEKTGMSLNLGGMAKGFAIDYFFETHDIPATITSITINFGGQLFFWKRSPGPISVQVDWEGSPTVEILPPASVSTSNSRERGKHLIDPQTGTPVAWDGCVSVASTSAAAADAFSTAYFILNKEETSDRNTFRFYHVQNS